MKTEESKHQQTRSNNRIEWYCKRIFTCLHMYLYFIYIYELWMLNYATKYRYTHGCYNISITIERTNNKLHSTWRRTMRRVNLELQFFILFFFFFLRLCMPSSHFICLLLVTLYFVGFLFFYFLFISKPLWNSFWFDYISVYSIAESTLKRIFDKTLVECEKSKNILSFYLCELQCNKTD